MLRAAGCAACASLAQPSASALLCLASGLYGSETISAPGSRLMILGSQPPEVNSVVRTGTDRSKTDNCPNQGAHRPPYLYQQPNIKVPVNYCVPKAHAGPPANLYNPRALSPQDVNGIPMNFREAQPTIHRASVQPAQFLSCPTRYDPAISDHIFRQPTPTREDVVWLAGGIDTVHLHTCFTTNAACGRVPRNIRARALPSWWRIALRSPSDGTADAAGIAFTYALDALQGDEAINSLLLAAHPVRAVFQNGQWKDPSASQAATKPTPSHPTGLGWKDVNN
ncbi:uncharacterized protein B0T15DRAFT_571726, partial [Chaetomium strumarium]